MRTTAQQFAERLALAAVNLPPDDLNYLGTVSNNEALDSQFPRAGEWVSAIIHAEQQRRAGASLPFPMPDIPAMTDGDVGDLLAGCIALNEAITSDRQHDLIGSLLFVVAAHATTRLKTRHIVQGN